MDLAAEEGTPVLAAADGIITNRIQNPVKDKQGNIVLEGLKAGYGRYIVLSHGVSFKAPDGSLKLKSRDGSSTLYGHLSSSLRANGDVVRKGQIIGFSGNTGRSTGPHLHFEFVQAGQIILSKSRIDGMPFVVKEDLSQLGWSPTLPFLKGDEASLLPRSAESLVLNLDSEAVPYPLENLFFKSSDVGIAKISDTGLVTAVSNGTATITATQVSSGKTATATITVGEAQLTVERTGATNIQATFDISVDGVSKGTVTLGPAGSASASKKLTFTGLVSGSHTLRIRYIQEPGNYILGYNLTLPTGITFSDGATTKGGSLRSYSPPQAGLTSLLFQDFTITVP